jgi:hypothetical protein
MQCLPIVKAWQNTLMERFSRGETTRVLCTASCARV